MKYKKNYKKLEQGKYVEILGFSNRDRAIELDIVNRINKNP